MAQAPPDAPGAGDGSIPTSEGRLRFEAGGFAPVYYPEKVVIRKKRETKEASAVCDGQYVSDHGSENIKVFADGILVGTDLAAFYELVDLGRPITLICEQWSGEVLLKKARVEGPTAWDGGERAWQYDYSMDFISTGRDESSTPNYGIVTNPDRGLERDGSRPTGHTDGS